MTLANIRKKKSKSYIRNKRKEIGDSYGDSNASDISMCTVQSLHDFDEEMDQLHQSYLRKACRCSRQIEMSHTRKEIRQSENLLSLQLCIRKKIESKDSIHTR